MALGQPLGDEFSALGIVSLIKCLGWPEALGQVLPFFFFRCYHFDQIVYVNNGVCGGCLFSSGGYSLSSWVQPQNSMTTR